jgi:AcrR family transcriptional regulator
MSPYPAQVDRLTIVETARQMIEAEGAENLSLHRLAAALKVRAPSLYRYVDSKAELLRAVNTNTMQHLAASLGASVAISEDPSTRIIRMARAYRDFTHANPATYQMAFGASPPEARPDSALIEKLALPLQGVFADLIGEGDALPALRGMWAMIHGFVMLELNGQFRRGGNMDAVYEQVILVYLDGLILRQRENQRAAD